MASRRSTAPADNRIGESSSQPEEQGRAKARRRKEHLDRKLDDALDDTFPASDPIELSADD